MDTENLQLAYEEFVNISKLADNADTVPSHVRIAKLTAFDYYRDELLDEVSRISVWVHERLDGK